MILRVYLLSIFWVEAEGRMVEEYIHPSIKMFGSALAFFCGCSWLFVGPISIADGAALQ